jgi:hypothetical protein
MRSKEQEFFLKIQNLVIGSVALTACAVVQASSQPPTTQPRPVDRSVLPIPAEPFQGTMGLRSKDSTPSFPPKVTAPAGAPNVVMVLMDDVGIGATSPFGGPINTPTIQKLADNGLRYNRFHTTAVCSPTRAALITGRNSPFGPHRRRHGDGDGIPRLRHLAG